MKTIWVINGVNLNMLGVREPDLYGKEDYKALVRKIKTHAKEIGVRVKTLQSNSEGEICEFIQRAYRKADGIVINPGAYTHTSVAILDALKAVGIPTVEVHITDVDSREEFRKISFVSYYAFERVIGKGLEGYCLALDALVKHFKGEEK